MKPTIRFTAPRRAYVPGLRRASLLALLAASFPGAVRADTPPTASTPLDTIVVRSGAFERTADELVQRVDVLSGETLERNRRGTLGDVLNLRPGIASASFGPGVGRPVIRGQGGPRVQMLENGIASMDASSISADHAVSIDPLNADQIEVIKGPATLIYGGGASAGIVNVVDDRLPDHVTPGLRLRGNTSYGSNGDERNHALRLGWGLGALQFGVDFSDRDAGDFEIPGYATREGAEDAHDHDHDHAHADEPERYGVLENSRLRTESHGASAAWVQDRGMAGVTVRRFTSNYGIAGHSHAHEDDGGTPGGDDHGHEDGDIRIDLDQTRTDLRGLLLDPLPGFERLEVRAGFNDYTHLEVEPDGTVGTRFDVNESESRVELAHRPLAGWVGVAGIHHSDRDFVAEGAEAFVPPVVTRGLGIFLVEGLALGNHHLELGARIDRVRHDADVANDNRQDFTPVSLSAGTHIKLADHLHLRINLQRAQRAPAAEELFAFGPHLATQAFERGNLQLDPETANNLDLSIGLDHGRWTWEASVFYNRIDDYIFPQEVDQGLNADGSGTAFSDDEADRVDERGQHSPDGELLLLDFVQQNADFYGAELSSEFHLLQDGPVRLSLNGFGDIVRGELRDGGIPLPRMTPVRLGIGADAAYGPITAAISYIRVMEQDRLAPLETNTPGHDLVNADLGYTLERGGLQATLYLQGRNLLDEKQRLSTSFLKDISPQPGRSVFAGLRFDFFTSP